MLALGAGLAQRGHMVHCFFFQDDGYAHAFTPRFPTTIGGAAALRDLLREGRYDVVHGDSCMMDLPAVLKTIPERPPLVITRHSWNAPMGWRRDNCDGYSAVCESAAALSRPYTDINVVAIPNGVDTAMFQPRPGMTPERPIVAWCGRSSDPVKNWAQFVSVTWRLGDGLAYYAADADAATAPDADKAGAGHISPRQRLSREELPDFYSTVGRSGGCLISTSRAEGGRPLAMLEAMACGCPVLGPDVRGVRDLLTGELRRWLFRPDADDAEVTRFVRDALEELADPAVRAQFRRYVLEHCTQELMVARYEQLYRDAAEAPCAGEDPPAEIAQRLWAFAGEARDEGRTRDAMFAARAATRLAPATLLRPAHFALLASCGSDSRMRGARASLRSAREQFDRRHFRAGLAATLRACRLHPAALLAPESPLRTRGRA
jgi:glycosyltransferase involved in cell wall biosynthesis